LGGNASRGKFRQGKCGNAGREKCRQGETKARRSAGRG
jgi:hypothetical protein